MFLSFRVNGVYLVRVPYHYSINRFDIDSLQLQIKRSSITFLYKILQNQILRQISFFIPFLNTRTTNTLYSNRAMTKLFLKSPMYKMCIEFSTVCISCDIQFSHINFVPNVAKQHLDDDMFKICFISIFPLVFMILLISAQYIVCVDIIYVTFFCITS